MVSLVRGTPFIGGIKSGKGKSVCMNILICGLNREFLLLYFIGTKFGKKVYDT